MMSQNKKELRNSQIRKCAFIAGLLFVGACGTTSNTFSSTTGNKIEVIVHPIGLKKDINFQYGGENCNASYLARESELARKSSTGINLIFKCESGSEYYGNLFVFGSKAAELTLQKIDGEDYKIPLIIGKQL